MRTFWAVLVKDLKVRFSTPMELVFFILLPLVFTIVLSGSMGSAGSPRGGGGIPLVLVQDKTGSPANAAILAFLSRMPDLKVKTVTDPTELIRSADPDLLLVLGESTTFRLSPWRGSAGATAARVGELLRAAAAGGSAETRAAASSEVTPTPAAVTPAPASSRAPTAAAPAATGSAGQVVTWVLVPLLGLGSAFAGERRRGTMRRILTTPAAETAVVSASVSAEMLAGLVQIMLLVLFGTLAFGLPWFAHPLALTLVSIAFCAAGAALGSLIGVVCRTPRQAGSLGLAAAMVLAVFGGCWYPAALFPSSLKTVVRLDPAGWAMDGFLSVLSPGALATPVTGDTALLAVFAAAIFAVAALAARAGKARAA